MASTAGCTALLGSPWAAAAATHTPQHRVVAPGGAAGTPWRQPLRRAARRSAGGVAVAAAAAASPSPPPAIATSLVPQTLLELEGDEELQQLHARVQLVGQAALTRDERVARQRSLDALGAPPFAAAMREAGVSPLVRRPTSILQLNIGLYCNQACKHCHVESSPKRTETMSREVAERCVALLEADVAAVAAASAAASSSSSNSSSASRGGGGGVRTLDLTGGAPELAPQFRYLVGEARRLGLEVIDRCNLTVLLEPGQEDLVAFLAEHHVRVVASMPCYSAENVNKQRGGGVFDRSIAALQALNAAGYGAPGSGLQLDLVYNPGGVFLAPPQAKLQEAYKQELAEHFGVVFNSLLCLNNMPIKRWADHLAKEGRLGEYMELLVGAFNPAAAEGLMCRDTLSVGWDGRLFDCDFNQQLELGLVDPRLRSVFDLGSLGGPELVGQAVAVDSHCFGCTAGAGSGCQGATSAA